MAERTKVGEKTKSSGGDPNILRISDTNKIRIVDEDQIHWRQHTIKHTDDEDQVEFVPCPGPKLCPLCRKPAGRDGKQRFPISNRYATNVWDYGSNGVKILIAGPQVFKEFEASKEVGIDPAASDWVIHKMGSGINTTYKMVRTDTAPFQHEISPDDLHNLDKYGEGMSPERIFEKLEEAGWDYDKLETPEFTLEQAEAFILPYGKGKGMTVEQALAQFDDWCEWLHGQKLADGSFGDPVFVALHTVMEDRGIVGPIDDMPDPSEAPPTEPEADTVTVTSQVEVTSVKLKGPDGNEVEVPQEAADALISAGFERVIDLPAGDSKPQVTPTAKGTAVSVKVGGHSITMTFGAAVITAKAGAPVEFGEDEADYANLLISTGGEPPDSVEAPQSDAEHAMHQEGADPKSDSADDKPFKCEETGCDWSGKTAGALTQHRNKVHGGSSQAPGANNGSGGDVSEETLGRVKDKLKDYPAEDYNVLLKLFEEIAGKRNISDFNEQELLALEAKLDAKKAEAAKS